MGQELTTWLGLPEETIDTTAAWNYPTIEILAQYVATELNGTNPSPPQPQIRSKPSDNLPDGQAPIAIVGMACRLPGGVNTPAEFWQLLVDGVDAITEIPSDRWEVNAFYDPDPETPGKMYTCSGAFLEAVDRFDARFFGISPREAVGMDPQQRLLLEVSWEALEYAGLATERLRGSRTGVFMGLCADDYIRLSVKADDPSTINPYNSLGNARSVAAGRLSYVFGLQGPTMQVDTACSSSLLAVHLACQSLRTGECNMALAGGVNLILSPETTISFCKMKALSPDGRSKTFDAAADGYGRGEGCGVVVLKRLSTALADGDNILAVIRGSAVNHDGQSNGLTAPNGVAQTDVIRQALQNADAKPADIQYVETHGSGTVLGDPIEVLALNTVFSQERETPLLIGSVKTNLGHLEGAAGIAGLLKVVLALQHRQLPANLHFKQPNPHIPWEELAVQVPTELTPWPAEAKGRLAGVSAFGLSGTNVHLILGEAGSNDEQTRIHHSSFSVHPYLLTLSAKTESALQALAQRYEQ
ncbi:MAG: polyketide synthase, partial [Gammaproteobacteria bacterium]|nr:polyketide synthase [Gammaproteobacteria bacterium]